jgi:glycosyltransferase involved in cell wall biosynthesis
MMQHIGLMMVRNEIDIIDRYIEHINDIGIDIILVLDDSDDGTYERLRTWPKVKYIVKQKTLYGDQQPCDGMRQCLLKYMQRNYGYEDWIHLLHPDEFFWDNPIMVAEEADAHGYDQVNWHSIYFFLHPDDKGEKGLPTYYSPGTIEERQFKNRRNLYYDPIQDHKTTPYGLDNLMHITPIIRHYPLRNPEQAQARAYDRLATGFQEQYHWVIEEPFPQCHPKLMDKGAFKFDGISFGGYEVKEQFIQWKKARLDALDKEIKMLEQNGLSRIA